ncbi:hypothetical protein OsI_39208 [Oryza sativa Indica Group]|jgi:hypothetical protein|uniref:Uncharacterized protein n=1 Tax=Oryza sativa subsp. indica TaxID=39946 RepID=A2ZMZ9_ORYSI|nr:hypothetical protein OsI_39208 [Oryza sativa Indica Group]
MEPSTKLAAFFTDLKALERRDRDGNLGKKRKPEASERAMQMDAAPPGGELRLPLLLQLVGSSAGAAPMISSVMATNAKE